MMTTLLRRRFRTALPLLLGAAVGTLLPACASDSGGSVNTNSSRSGALPSDTAAPTSPAGTPISGSGAGSSMGSNGLGGGRGSF